MSRLVYLMNVSLDGFVEGPDGRFDWSRPDDEVHRFHNQLAREADAFLYGRRMYETMAGWQTADEDPSAPELIVEFARLWKAKPKLVFSTTLASAPEGFRLVRGDAAAEVERMKQAPGGDLAVSGPGLASSLARRGLIDELRLVVFPVLVGAGKPYLPGLDRELSLRLVESLRFRCGAVFLRYLR